MARSTRPSEHVHGDFDPSCDLCRNNLPFDLPDFLLDACHSGDLVVFAGAGVSTEARHVTQHTFYERIAGELGGAEADEAFPALMSRFEATFSRRVLVQRIQERFANIDAFPDLRDNASRFHRELATLFYCRTVVTTNWDTYFEEDAGALPFVTDDDYALWELPGRKVFKLHGSRTHVGSIVATEDDYKKSYKRLHKSLLGATLKHAIATRPILFVGYSFRDRDFENIYSFIQKQLGDLLPRVTIVTLDESVPKLFGDVGHVVRTDATYFLRNMKERLLDRGCLLSDSNWAGISGALQDVRIRQLEIHERLDIQKLPAVVLCGYYQDGIIHAFERMLQRRRTGEYSHICDVQRKIEIYDKWQQNCARRRKYHDAAYIEGYSNGLAFLLCDEKQRRLLPKYFVYGSKRDLRSLTAFRREANCARVLHQGAYRLARRIVDGMQPGIVSHHRPELT